MAGQRTLEITDDNFEEKVMKADKPVLLDFWAEWCGPCKAVAPILEDLAVDYEGKVYIGKVDVDTNRKVATKYQIRSIPTLLLFKNGEVVGQKVGAGSKAGLEEFLEKAF